MIEKSVASGAAFAARERHGFRDRRRDTTRIGRRAERRAERLLAAAWAAHPGAELQPSDRRDRPGDAGRRRGCLRRSPLPVGQPPGPRVWIPWTRTKDAGITRTAERYTSRSIRSTDTAEFDLTWCPHQRETMASHVNGFRMRSMQWMADLSPAVRGGPAGRGGPQPFRIGVVLPWQPRWSPLQVGCVSLLGRRPDPENAGWLDRRRSDRTDGRASDR